MKKLAFLLTNDENIMGETYKSEEKVLREIETTRKLIHMTRKIQFKLMGIMRKEGLLNVTFMYILKNKRRNCE